MKRLRFFHQPTLEGIRDSNVVSPVAVVALLTVIIQIASALAAPPIHFIPGAQSVRIGHALLAACIFLAAIFSKGKWSRGRASVLFVAIIAPYFLSIWLNHLGYLELDALGAPLAGPKLIFLGLAVLVPGSLWLNATLLIGFLLESLVIWRYLAASKWSDSLPHEPVMTFLFGVVALALLWFRKRDENLIKQISAGKAREEALTGLARIFLSLRNLSNTPLQTLTLSLELIKRRHPEALSALEPMSTAVEKLNRMNSIYARLESDATWGDRHLMSEEEIVRWIAELENRTPFGERPNRTSH